MAITLLTTPPPSLDRDELSSISSSTPQTFEGIPPLLRHYEADGVSVRVDPAHEGFSGEGVEGGLWVTEGALSFFSPSSSTGISIPYTHITLHAISRSSAPSSSTTTTTANGGERPCVYVQFEQEEGAEESDEYDGSGSREMWITPREAESVDKIFSTISYCCSLHPTTSSTAPPGVLSSSSSNGASSLNENGESSSHFNNPSASLFASMGLDPDSMVYAGEDGQLAGPGLAALLAAEGAEGGEYEDAEEETGQQQEGEGGRQRSEYVNPGRARGAPY